MNTKRCAKALLFKAALILIGMSLFAVSCGGGEDETQVESRVKNVAGGEGGYPIDSMPSACYAERDDNFQDRWCRGDDNGLIPNNYVWPTDHGASPGMDADMGSGSFGWQHQRSTIDESDVPSDADCYSVGFDDLLGRTYSMVYFGPDHMGGQSDGADNLRRDLDYLADLALVVNDLNNLNGLDSNLRNLGPDVKGLNDDLLNPAIKQQSSGNLDWDTRMKISALGREIRDIAQDRRDSDRGRTLSFRDFEDRLYISWFLDSLGKIDNLLDRRSDIDDLLDRKDLEDLRKYLSPRNNYYRSVFIKQSALMPDWRVNKEYLYASSKFHKQHPLDRDFLDRFATMRDNLRSDLQNFDTLLNQCESRSVMTVFSTGVAADDDNFGALKRGPSDDADVDDGEDIGSASMPQPSVDDDVLDASVDGDVLDDLTASTSVCVDDGEGVKRPFEAAVEQFRTDLASFRVVQSGRNNELLTEQERQGHRDNYGSAYEVKTKSAAVAIEVANARGLDLKNPDRLDESFLAKWDSAVCVLVFPG